jgi:hypothetical protein
LEEQRPVQTNIGMLNLLLTSCGLMFFAIGSYTFLSQSSLFYPGQYFFIFGIILSCMGMISIFVKLDF